MWFFPTKNVGPDGRLAGKTLCHEKPRKFTRFFTAGFGRLCTASPFNPFGAGTGGTQKGWPAVRLSDRTCPVRSWKRMRLRPSGAVCFLSVGA